MLVFGLILKCITHRLVGDQKRTLHVNSKKTTSKTARVNAVKEQIRVREIGYGGGNFHISWSKTGRYFTEEELRYQLIDSVLSVEGERDIPPDPKVDLPSRGE